MTTNWIEQFDNKYYQSVYDAFPEYKVGNKILLDDIKNFITTLLEKQMEEYVEMIKNHVTQIDGNKDEVLSAMYTAEKLKQDIIDKIKSHDKTS